MAQEPMPTFEDELKRVEPVARMLSRLALLGKKLVIHGDEHFIRQGPNILVGNHCGSFKDGAVVYLGVPRPLFFTANKQIFSRTEFNALVRKHLRRNLRGFGTLVNFLVNPFKALVVTYISSNIAKVGAIPVDLYNHGKREAIERCQEYLRAGRAIVALQGRGRVVPSDPNPYVRAFSRGTSIIACNMRERFGIDVPVTPLALFGTHLALFVPGKAQMNVGAPMYAADYMGGGLDASATRFKDALEAKVKALLIELIRGGRGPGLGPGDHLRREGLSLGS